MNEKLKTWATVAKHVGRLLRLATLVGAAAGAILMAVYCSRINYFPRGVTIADALSFLWAILVFGFFYVIFFLVLLGATVGIVAAVRRPGNWLLSKTDPKERSVRLPSFPGVDGMLVFIGVLCNLILVVALWSAPERMMTVYLSAGIVAALYIGVASLPRNRKGMFKKRHEVVVTAYACAMFLAPLMFGGIFGSSLNNAMSVMGVRAERVAIATDEATSNIVSGVLKMSGDQQQRFAKEGQAFVIKDVDVLFTEIGQNTLIGLTVNKEQIRIPLPFDKVTVVYRSRAEPERAAAGSEARPQSP